MKKEIQLSVPNLDIEIVENLRECIETGWVSTGGKFIGEFEKKIAEYVGVESAVSTQSGTAGIHLALKALGIGKEDKVIVPSLTFVAAVNPVIYQGAIPVFMDCDDSLCIDTNKLEEYLKKNRGKVKAVIAVHIFGNLANMERIMELAEKYGLKVLEDATEALGTYVTEGKYKGHYAGTIGDIGIYSFNANKIITTGGGGMIVAKDEEILEHMRHLSITAKTDSLYFIHDEVGYNYRMLNTQAALGVSQIDKIERFIKTKIINYNLYKELLDEDSPKGLQGIRLLPFNDGLRANHWFYSLLIDEEKLGIGRNELMDRLIGNGIQCRPIWKLIHTLCPYERYEAFEIEKAPYYEKNILNIPCSTSLTTEEVKHVCEMIKKIVKQ
ncbi:aminotransferase class I/II-fold pyridoxal phosphate-dependent enzyme [Anaerovorax odorimutans]|uniref:aminotransferase class I/II-fold pyridoxal phosphate-dependent enzyme n=1 Tax=Anaerovorax odorimutans TaxID=109327 RepID=UPI00040E254E|nr:aminotransferase class I/II-fold pyridoxal phosphate-dependent enzyme [Anaerovorax odorimutans]